MSHLSSVDPAGSESCLGHSATGRPQQSSPATVAVWDQAYERLQSINEIIKLCGANSLLLQDPAQISSVERSFSQTVALVALGDSFGPGLPRVLPSSAR